MGDESEPYVEMSNTSVESGGDLYLPVANVKRRTGSPSPTSTTPTVPCISNASVSSRAWKSQTMRIRRLNRSTGSILASDSPSSSPLELREKKFFSPPGPMHLEPDTEVSLQELVTMHHEMLPLQVRVCKKKVQEEANQVSLAMGGLYNLHFTVHRKIATFTSTTGETFTLPADSNAICALVYNPEGDARRALAGYTFLDVADLAKAQKTPVIVCATQPGDSGKVESAALAEGEILALKNVYTKEGKNYIGAYSFMTESVKILEDGCSGGFTTHPNKVQLPLRRVVNELDLKLPCYVCTFGTEEREQHSANADGSLRLLSLQVAELVLLVATSPQTPDEVLEVSVTPDTEVKMVEVGGRDLLEMKSETCLLQSKYHLPKKGKSVSGSNLGSNNTSVSSYPGTICFQPQTQSEVSLYDLPCDAHAHITAMQLRSESQAVRKDFPPGTGGSPGTLKNNVAPALLSSPSVTSNGAAATDFKFPEMKSQDEAIAYEVQSAEWSLKAKCEELQHSLSLCTESLREQRKEIAAAHRDIANLQKEVEVLKHQRIQGDRTLTTGQENISLLTALSTKEVLQLLEGLGLSQYKKKFNSERISGKILVQCNEKVLEKDLGVSNKLHRMRLMEFIQGRECVHTVISKQ